MSNCEVTIISTCQDFDFNQQDIDNLNKNDESIEFTLGLRHGDTSSADIFAVIQFMGPVIIETVKVVAPMFFDLIQTKMNNKETAKIAIECNGVVHSVSFSKSLPKEQQKKTIEVFLNKVKSS